MIRVVVADPAEIWRAAVCSLLENASGFEVIGVAASGAEALHLLGELQPDVILMDLDLPGITPSEAFKLVRKGHAGTRLVIVTTNNDLHVMNAAIAGGISSYVHKADFGAELVIAIRMAVNRRSFISSRMCEAISMKLSQFASSH